MTEIACHNYAEAKRVYELKKLFIKILRVTLCVRSKQPLAIKGIIYDDIFSS